MKKPTVLILGATGGIGNELMHQLKEDGYRIRALNRNLAFREIQKDGISWIKGDALIRDDVITAAHGCSVIVHAVNPPGYKNWPKLVLSMLDNTIAAASHYDATVVLPGTVYNYGPDAGSLVSEDAPQRPKTRKGAIRAEMEDRLQNFTQDGGRAIILRAGDFYGPNAVNNWLSQGLIKPNRRVKRIWNPAAYGVGHQWAYLPDVAKNICKLLNKRQELEPFARFHMGGHWDADGMQIPKTIQKIVLKQTGKEPKIKLFPWWMLKLVAPIQETPREIMEMRYLWQQPLQLDNAKLIDCLGEEFTTSLDVAIETTLKGFGCLDDASELPGSDVQNSTSSASRMATANSERV